VKEIFKIDKMKQKRILKIAIVVSALGIISSCNNGQTTTDEEQTKTEARADTIKPADSLSVAYQCPMKCEGEKTYAQAGKCPECEMDLEKVKK
jgi:hypothetical protein